MPRSRHGGRHELGQNFLTHRPTIDRLISLVRRTRGPILEIGCGDGALTDPLSQLGRPLIAIDLDEHLVSRVQRRLPSVQVVHADVLRHPLDADVIVGNLPFHLTTAILRRILIARRWRHAVLVTQWEVARRRAGVGGRTLLTAQAAPWFEFGLDRRIPSTSFDPRPGVDGGILMIERRTRPLIPDRERNAYERFVKRVFTGPGGSLDRILQRASGLSAAQAKRVVADARIPKGALPRDLEAEHWAAVWQSVRAESPDRGSRRADRRH